MNHTPPSPLRRLAISLALLALAAGATSSVRAAVQYTVTDLGTLGGAWSSAFGINNSGTIVGASYPSSGPQHAFSYSGGVMTDLGTLGGTQSRACGINDVGTIVGWAYPSGSVVQHAFSYSSGVMTDIGAIGQVAGRSYANAINNTGTIVGGAQHGPPRGSDLAFTYTDGVLTSPPYLPYSVANAVNSAGTYVGQAWGAGNGDYHAWIVLNGVMYDLGTLGGANSHAFDINDSNIIVGESHTSSGRAEINPGRWNRADGS